MASKGQKFKRYTLVQKEEVLAKYIEGYSAKYLEEIYGISRKTIETWKQKVLHPEKYLGQGQKRGRLQRKIWDTKKIPSLPQFYDNHMCL